MNTAWPASVRLGCLRHKSLQVKRLEVGCRSRLELRSELALSPFMSACDDSCWNRRTRHRMGGNARCDATVVNLNATRWDYAMRCEGAAHGHRWNRKIFRSKRYTKRGAESRFGEERMEQDENNIKASIGALDGLRSRHDVSHHRTKARQLICLRADDDGS